MFESSQLNCKYLGNRVENEIVEAVCAAPQLLKLGIALEFRDALNKTAIQLLKNLDRSKCSPYTVQSASSNCIL